MRCQAGLVTGHQNLRHHSTSRGLIIPRPLLVTHRSFFYGNHYLGLHLRIIAGLRIRKYKLRGELYLRVSLLYQPSMKFFINLCRLRHALRFDGHGISHRGNLFDIYHLSQGSSQFKRVTCDGDTDFCQPMLARNKFGIVQVGEPVG